MAEQLQLRGGTATQNDTFTGASREVTVDTTNWNLRVHDGQTPGGHVVGSGGGGSVPTLEEVTTQGNTSSNSIIINTKIELNSDGSTNFQGVGTFFDDLETTGKLTAVTYSLETLPVLP